MVRMMSDPDEQVAQTAIGASYNGGAVIDRALVGLVGNANLDASRRTQAAQQLRSRGVALDDATRAAIDALLGAEGKGGGGGRFHGYGDW